MAVRPDSYTDPAYQAYLRQQQLQQQQQALAQQQQQDAAAAQAAADAAAQAEAEKQAQSGGSAPPGLSLPAPGNEDQIIEFMSQQQQQPQPQAATPSVQPVADAPEPVPDEVQSAPLPEGYKVSSWEKTEGGYSVQLGLDEQQLADKGGTLTPSGSYQFSNLGLPSYLQGASFGGKFQKDPTSGVWEDLQGNDVDYWDVNPTSGELTAYFKQGSVTAAANPYASFGEGQYFNDKAGFVNVSGAGGIGTDPYIVDPTQQYVPISSHIMSVFNDFAKAQGDAIFIPSQFKDVSGAGGIGTDPERIGSTPITKAEAISGIGQFAAGAVASVESIYLGNAVPNVWGAGIEQLQVGLGQRSDAPMSEWLAQHPNYALGNIMGEAGQAVIMGEAMKAISSPAEGMTRVRAFDEIPTSFRTKQELTIGGRSYTRISDVEQAGKIELRGKAFDMPSDELYRARVADITDARGNRLGFEVTTQEPKGSLTTIYRGGAGNEKYIYNAADAVDLRSKTFKVNESWLKEGLTEDLLRDSKGAIKLENLEGDFLKEQYSYSRQIPYNVASGRSGLGQLPTHSGYFSPTTSYYGDIAKAGGKASSAAGDLANLAKSSKAAEIMDAAGGKAAQAITKEGAGASPVQQILKQESGLQSLYQGSKVVPVEIAGQATWAGLYAGAKAAYEVGVGVGTGVKPKEISGMDLQQPVKIGNIGSVIQVPEYSRQVPIIKPISDLPMVGEKPVAIPVVPVYDPTPYPTVVIPRIKNITVPMADQTSDVVQIQKTSMNIPLDNLEVMQRFSPKARGPRRDKDLLTGMFGKNGRLKYEERINPFKSAFEMPSSWGISGHKSRRSRRGAGLLWAIGTALASLFALYFISSLLLPAIGTLDWHIFQFINNPAIPFSGTWIDVYNTLIPFMRNAFIYLVWGAVFAIIMFVVIQANKREPNQYEG